jgi:hypothetical protein
VKRAWEAGNPERVANYARKSSAKWRANNIDLARKRVLISRRKKAEHYAEQTRRWQKENAARCRAKYKKYMTRKLHAMPAWADEFLIQQFYDRCTKRNKLLTNGVRWHVDHIVPLQSTLVCGLHTHHNLRVVRVASNLSKGNRYWPDMWATRV